MTPQRQSKAVRVGVCALADGRTPPRCVDVGEQQHKLRLSTGTAYRASSSLEEQRHELLLRTCA